MSDASTAPSNPRDAEAQADQAAVRGDVQAARRLLAQVTEQEPDRVEPWLKLAAMCRAQGQIGAALDAVSGALRVQPLGFVPLLLKASLLEAAGRNEEAGLVSGYALAQRPHDVPLHLQRALAQAEARHTSYVAQTEERLSRAIREVATTPTEARRLDRFRTNILRKTPVYHSEPTHFHYPGLREREFHDRGDFPWLEALEQATNAIREDLDRVLATERAELVPYVQYPDDVPLRQWAALNRSRDWTAIHLLRMGERVEANARHCPAVMKILEQIEQPVVARRSPNAMFSLLAPGAHIPPHTGIGNTRLVCHLPLIVPEGCWFRVGAETRPWREGEAWVFDDTIEHEAMNPSGKLRVILIVDVWHPDLSPAERAAAAATMEATDFDPASEAL
jgi:aspartyl/asparaginyl beta-hydroxylase (cupin superfamily)